MNKANNYNSNLIIVNQHNNRGDAPTMSTSKVFYNSSYNLGSSHVLARCSSYVRTCRRRASLTFWGSCNISLDFGAFEILRHAKAHNKLLAITNNYYRLTISVPRGSGLITHRQLRRGPSRQQSLHSKTRPVAAAGGAAGGAAAASWHCNAPLETAYLPSPSDPWA